MIRIAVFRGGGPSRRGEVPAGRLRHRCPGAPRPRAGGDQVASVATTRDRGGQNMATDFQERARRLRNAVEPVAAGVYFAPEVHAEYAALGFEPGPNLASKDGIA